MVYERERAVMVCCQCYCSGVIKRERGEGYNYIERVSERVRKSVS